MPVPLEIALNQLGALSRCSEIAAGRAHPAPTCALAEAEGEGAGVRSRADRCNIDASQLTGRGAGLHRATLGRARAAPLVGSQAVDREQQGA